jgi:hypothetical protein
MAKGSKTGGRKKGTPNRNTTELKEFFDSVDLCIPEEIIKLMPALEAKEQVGVYLKLMDYIYPRRKVIEAKPDSAAFSSISELVARCS